MNIEIQPPFFILEVETGDVSFCREISELRLFVEEFWDILEDDFKIWDGQGFLVSFEKAFLNCRPDSVHKDAANSLHQLRRHLNEFAKKHDLDVTFTEAATIDDIVKEVDKLII